MSTRRAFLTGVFVVCSGVLGFIIGDHRSELQSAPPVPELEVQTSKRPLIGIASLDHAAYIQAVRNHGGIPVVLPHTGGNIEMVSSYLEKLDGLIMPGGLIFRPLNTGKNLTPQSPFSVMIAIISKKPSSTIGSKNPTNLCSESVWGVNGSMLPTEER